MDGQNNCRVSGLGRLSNGSSLHGRDVLNQKDISNVDGFKQTSHTNQKVGATQLESIMYAA